MLVFYIFIGYIIVCVQRDYGFHKSSQIYALI